MFKKPWFKLKINDSQIYKHSQYQVKFINLIIKGGDVDKLPNILLLAEYLIGCDGH